MKKMRKTLLEYPILANELHPCNNKTAREIAPFSKKKYWWLCPKGHTYVAKCIDRAFGRGCPYCAGKKVCPDNCLATLYPELAKNWHPTRNENIKPTDVVSGTGKAYWWQCSKGHEYKSKCTDIVQNAKRGKGVGCPYCAGKKVCPDNCLAFLHPDIAAEWHPTKNGNILPKDVLSNTHKKYWWLCSSGHEWEARCHDRVGKGNGCPYCKESRGEKRIAKYLTVNKYKFHRQVKFIDCKLERPLPFDFMIEDPRQSLIEYQGKQHYFPGGFGASKESAEKEFVDVVKRDAKKTQWCEQSHRNLLIIPYWEFDNIENILQDYFSGKCPIISNPPKIVRKYENIRRLHERHRISTD
jgi:hypothetical protein